MDRPNYARRMLFPLSLLVFAILLAGCAAPRLHPDDEPRIAGKTYVITGASSGFGRGVAERLGALRANVVLAARRAEALKEVAAEASAAGGIPLVVTADVAKPEDMQRVADAAILRFGHLMYGSTMPVPVRSDASRKFPSRTMRAWSTSMSKA